ncbi:PadR family transcriptional regulator [Mesobacillus maritimus]|uniref:PadR family transcriptional regulator n=1 Tax=Mesobacillus maritimus TaxID=1643336 RepID=UPI00204186F2|nr:PadR family transcriptional regulator [Mesobacillus maritimus]MCM3587375.1 PadR family transcriptional regulator [Mesobacillus maritimus]MCM3667935.1 PadR family transcriptional regulator [Mesobacillus maritimus]
MKRRRGFIQLAVLHLLGERSMHGYQIMKELEERSDGMYKASAGTVYPALQELLDKGLIDLSMDELEKKTYSINSKGQQRLAEYAETEKGDIWAEWRERLIWRNSKEFIELEETVKEWEHELRNAMKKLRKHPENTSELIQLLTETKDILKRDFR